MIQNYQNNNQIKSNTNQRKNNNPKGARQAKGIKGVYMNAYYQELIKVTI